MKRWYEKVVKKKEHDTLLKQNTDFLKNMFRKSVFPCMLTILSVNVNVFVDGILVANRIGADALAAINLSLPLYLALCVVGSFLVSGTAINAAQEIGRNNREESWRYYSDCVVGSFFCIRVDYSDRIIMQGGACCLFVQ